MKKLHVEPAKCTGCRTCEVVCSLTHSKGHINPRSARVRVYRDEVEGIFTPIVVGPKARVEYAEEPRFSLGGKQGDIGILYSLFRDPSRECNQCGQCAQWCVTGALQLQET